jgi:adenosine deaminase
MTPTADDTFPAPDARMAAFIAGLPKAELHIHLEGAISPEQRRRIALRNGLPPESPLAGWDRDTTTTDPAEYLRKFLAAQFDCCSVLKKEQDFSEIAYEYLQASHADNVAYLELMFDPQTHTNRGVPFSVIINGIDDGRRRAQADFGIDCNLIMCINRERTAEEAVELMEMARPYRDKITGIGLDCSEEGNPPIKFRHVYEVARAEGYRLTAHCDAGQKNSVSHIWQCIEILHCDRIDHGNNAVEDRRLMDRIGEKGIVLACCPTWRPIDKKPRRLETIRPLYDYGLKVTLNTDDPGLFVSGGMGRLLPPVAATGNFTEADMVRLMHNAFEGSWASDEQKQRYEQRLRAYVSSFNAAHGGRG